MEPMISVIIPEFDDDTYLIRCLNSIKRQTYNNVEIIIAASKCDNKIIEKYNLKLLKKKEEYWDKLNTAIECSNGKYIFFCDVNMVLSPNALQQLLEEKKTEILFLQG